MLSLPADLNTVGVPQADIFGGCPSFEITAEFEMYYTGWFRNHVYFDMNHLNTNFPT